MSNTALMERNGFSKPTPPAPAASWLHQTAHSFFSGINWDDNPPEVEQVRLDPSSGDGPLSMMLTVRQFFTAINWDGTPAPSAPTEAPIAPFDASPPPAKNAFTLEDFSDLF